MAFDDALEAILRWEGGYSDHPNDPGGATNFGITIATLRRWRRPEPVTKEDVRNLPREEAREIYRAYYWHECRCDELPDGVALAVFDSAVNQGPERARRLLQTALRVEADGIFGPITMAAVAAADEATLLDEFMARRAVHYASLTAIFHLGWYRRVMDIHRRVLALV